MSRPGAVFDELFYAGTAGFIRSDNESEKTVCLSPIVMSPSRLPSESSPESVVPQSSSRRRRTGRRSDERQRLRRQAWMVVTVIAVVLALAGYLIWKSSASNDYSPSAVF
jgi:hypothetical protein